MSYKARVPAAGCAYRCRPSFRCRVFGVCALVTISSIQIRWPTAMLLHFQRSGCLPPRAAGARCSACNLAAHHQAREPDSRHDPNASCTVPPPLQTSRPAATRGGSSSRAPAARAHAGGGCAHQQRMQHKRPPAAEVLHMPCSQQGGASVRAWVGGRRQARSELQLLQACTHACMHGRTHARTCAHAQSPFCMRALNVRTIRVRARLRASCPSP